MLLKCAPTKTSESTHRLFTIIAVHSVAPTKPLTTSAATLMFMHTKATPKVHKVHMHNLHCQNIASTGRILFK